MKSADKFKLRCPGCKAGLHLKGKLATDKKISCPRCSQTFRVAKRRPPAAPAPKPNPEKAFAVPDIREDAPVAAPPAPRGPIIPSRPPALNKPVPRRRSIDEEDDETTPFWKRRPVVVSALVVFGVVCLWSFTGGTAQHTVYLAEGLLLYKGKPVEGARVCFLPVEQSKNSFQAHGVTDADGVFKLTTYAKDDGAPAGKYKVSIIASPPKAPLEKGAKGAAQDKNALPPHYRDAMTSGLTAEVKDVALNKLQHFDLK